MPEEEVELSKLLEAGLKELSSFIKGLKKKEIKTGEELAETVGSILKRTLPDKFKELKTKWEDPNKVIVEFKKLRTKEKMVKVLEMV